VRELGTVAPGQTIYFPFESFASSTGAPITITGLATSDIKVYKDGNTTERASASGYTLLDTDGIDFDGITGIHGFSIDLSDNTTADFWAAGSRYFVVVSTVTVDSQTMSFLAGFFRIGQVGALLDTTIATLSSQTSFTLASGPAEDNALLGWAIIHDAASAVQKSQVLITAYTGSTKTVTLAAAPSFTIAAKDNISILGQSPAMPFALPRAAGGVCDVWGAAGTAWGSGAITAASIASAAITAAKFATDAIDSAALAASAVSEIQSGLSTLTQSQVTGGAYALNSASFAFNSALDFTTTQKAATLARVTLVDILTTYTGNTPQTGDSFARIGATGSGLTSLAPSATALSTAQWSSARAAYLDNINNSNLASVPAFPSNFPSLGINASGHLSRVTLTDTATNLTNLPTIPVDWLTGSGLASSAVSEIQSGLSTLDAAGVRTAVGLASANLDSQIGSLATAASIAALNNISAAQVLTQVETAISSTTRSMPGQATPSATPTLAAAIMQMFQQATNPSDQDSSKFQLYNRAGDTVQQKRTVADDGTLFQLGALVTGP
jgi:hypothetical protein